MTGATIDEVTKKDWSGAHVYAGVAALERIAQLSSTNAKELDDKTNVDASEAVVSIMMSFLDSALVQGSAACAVV